VSHTDHLIPPHGGELVNLLVDEGRADELKAASRDWPSWSLRPRQMCDLELLLTGGFSPLRGFLKQDDYQRVLDEMRLTSGVLWPIPITLDVSEELAKSVDVGAMLALRDPEGVMIAALHVEQIWQPDREAEAQAVFGTTNREHPGVAYLLDSEPYYLGGRIEGLQLPTHYDFGLLRQTPAELRQQFARLGWRRVVAFQTRNPMHRAHQELTLRAAKELESNLLVHPVVGMTKPGDVDHYTRVRCYQALLSHYPHNTAMLSLLPLAMRMGGPREAIWHAIIRKNYGCTHLIVGRDHAGPGSDSSGKPFYGPYDAQELLQQHEEELDISDGAVQADGLSAEKSDSTRRSNEVPRGTRKIAQPDSGRSCVERLAGWGARFRTWFSPTQRSFEELQRKPSPARVTHRASRFSSPGSRDRASRQMANALLVKLLELGGRAGDPARRRFRAQEPLELSSVSRSEHRDLNIRRIGWVASEITKSGGDRDLRADRALRRGCVKAGAGA
jgi:sulfate adenylyltransferase